MRFNLEHPNPEDARERREEERLDEMREDGRTLFFDICMCTEGSYIGCPKHDPLYHERSKR